MTSTAKIVVVCIAVAVIVAITSSGSDAGITNSYSSYPRQATGSVLERSNCHSSYSGCLRADASDYDCARGSGNGPYYTDKVRVIGPDVFGLDRDHDGWGCE